MPCLASIIPEGVVKLPEQYSLLLPIQNVSRVFMILLLLLSIHGDAHGMLRKLLLPASRVSSVRLVLHHPGIKQAGSSRADSLLGGLCNVSRELLSIEDHNIR
jgi:hypothetical protein